MRVAIIGGGLTGLTAGYYLTKNHHQVTIFEKNPYLGGLAASFQEKNWSWPLEFYFHHIFTSDKEVINLAKDLGLDQKVFFLRPKTSIFKDGRISQFDSPFSVLKSPLLSPTQKLQTSLVTAYLKFTNDWQGLEKITAAKWLKKFYGRKTYETIWHPLLRSKFGQNADQISASWFWARIKKRSFSLGYFAGGFQTLIDKLAEEIKRNGGKILLNFELKNLNDIYHLSEFEKIIFTAPVSVFLKTAPKLPKDYEKQLKNLKMVGALNLVLILKEKFLTDNTYWLNINESNFPFVAVVEHTNFIDPKYYDGNHLLYVGGYYPQNHRYFKMSREQIFNEFLPYLQKINPFFSYQLSAISYQLFKNQYAQPIIPIDYSKIIPPFKTPIPNLYLATMQQIYPWDRGINYAVKLGKEIANEILKEN